MTGTSNDQLESKQESLEDRIAELERKVSQLNYVVYKLIYELGGKDIVERDNDSNSDH